MKMARLHRFCGVILVLVMLLSACSPAATPTPGSPRVIAAESFLADIAQNVAGQRLTIETLVPLGIDPHAFEPTPQDVAKVASADLIIINGGGFESWMEAILTSAGGTHRVIEASAGLTSREPLAVEEGEDHDHEHQGLDPHFWLNPQNVIQYVRNIRDSLAEIDPAGADDYTKNAEAYIQQLTDLDLWIEAQVAVIPLQERILITNHESFGYFADRYQFQMIGTVLPGVSTDAAPSAQQMANLINLISASGAKAIFIEISANPQLAEQIAGETGVTVVTQVRTHSLSAPGGDAPTYIEMMKHNTAIIVDALR